MTKSSIEHEKGAPIRKIYVETQTVFLVLVASLKWL